LRKKEKTAKGRGGGSGSPLQKGRLSCKTWFTSQNRQKKGQTSIGFRQWGASVGKKDRLFGLEKGTGFLKIRLGLVQAYEANVLCVKGKAGRTKQEVQIVKLKVTDQKVSGFLDAQGAAETGFGIRVRKPARLESDN